MISGGKMTFEEDFAKKFRLLAEKLNYTGDVNDVEFDYHQNTLDVLREVDTYCLDKQQILNSFDSLIKEMWDESNADTFRLKDKLRNHFPYFEELQERCKDWRIEE